MSTVYCEYKDDAMDALPDFYGELEQEEALKRFGQPTMKQDEGLSTESWYWF